jgi:methionyl-tRNA synthetase
LYDNGDFIEQVTEQLYDKRLISSWQTVLLLELVQNGNEEAYGDQCENVDQRLTLLIY